MQEETRSISVQKKTNGIRKYESSNKSDFIAEEDIVGLDANILVDMVESEEFKKDILEQINIGVHRLYTTNVTLSEAREVLKRRKGYTHEEATKHLQAVLTEFNIVKINHNKEGSKLGDEWFDMIKEKMFIKKFKTFPIDCRIIANLFVQSKINFFLTEDQDIEKAISILKIPIRVRITGEASNISGYEVKRFFKGMRKDLRKYRRQF